MSSKLKNSAVDKPTIVVILEPHHESTRLLRLAKRKSQHEGVVWEVLYVETPEIKREFNAKEKESLLNNLTLAEQMGAKVHKKYANTTFDGVKEFLKQKQDSNHKVFSIFIGKTNKKKRFPDIRKTLVDKMLYEFGGDYNLVVVRLGLEVSVYSRYSNLLRVNLKEILISISGVLLATIVIELLNYIAPEIFGSHNRNKSIIYMVACAFAAGRYGFISGIVASIASFLALHLLYVSPNFSLILNSAVDAANLALFLCAGIILSLFSSKDCRDRHSLAKNLERFDSLLKVHRIALSGNDYIEVVAALDKELEELLGTNISFFFPSIKNKAVLHTLLTDDTQLSEEDERALAVCWSECKVTGVGAPYNPEGCNWRFEPLLTANNEMGVMGVYVKKRTEVDVDFGRLLSGIADQVALILERLGLEELAEDTRVKIEKEKLRAMLLSSVSHDLKTPLASIIGSLSVYRSMGERLRVEQRATLITTAIDEAQRLDSFITNILDMTKIESGQIELKEEWVNPDHLVRDSIKRLKERLRYHIVFYDPPKQEVEVLMDYIMTGQVLQNLLDNAVKYTKLGTKIEISWVAEKSGFVLSVRDNGDGIPEGNLEKVFDKYARIKKQDSQVAGTGLGLAIAKAVMQAQRGNIVANNHPNGGAVFTITLPKLRKVKGKEVA